MRLKHIFLIIISISILSIGCTKFIDKQPQSFYTQDNFYKDSSQIEAGVIGCYASLRNVYNLDYILAGLRSDDAYISESDGDINQIDFFSETTTNSYVQSYWQAAYFTINQCNTVLKYLDTIKDPIKKNQYEGELKFIRAQMYFNLVRLYGDIPLVLNTISYTDSSAFKRVNKDTVYNYIIKDFQVAIQKLPIMSDPSQIARVNLYAAKGMLAKVYLTQQNYQDSKVILTDLLNNSGPYKLLSDYRSVFGINNEMNPEVMFAVRYQANSNGMGNYFTYSMAHLSGSPGFRAATDFRGSTPFPEADSLRKYQTFVVSTSSTGSKSYYCGGKYQDLNSAQNDGGSDFIVLRYADIILMYAEVENEINGNTLLTVADATNPSSRLYQLNRIRTRACGSIPAAVPVYVYSSTSVKTQSGFRSTLKAERRRELGEEDQRWYDLIRWGDAVSVMNSHFLTRAINTVIDNHQTVYPIPQREIDIASGYGYKMDQNSGY